MRIDITGKIGDLFQHPPVDGWAMYSLSRPAYMVWNEIANVMHERGMTEAEISKWLRSKDPRLALDDDLGSKLLTVAREWAEVNWSKEETQCAQ